MIPGLVSQELHEQLLDPRSYQSRTNGVDELKRILSEVEIKSIPCDSIEDFIKFLPRLLDDSNFKVLYGALQVLNLLIEKLESSVDRYFKHIVLVALKALGDTRTLTRNEYLNVFQQLMKTVEPQQVLDLVVANLKHKNSRVREDVLNIIMAAILTHPRKDFNIPKLCFEVAPYLADSKRRVRLAAFELFAVFDSCLDTRKKPVLMKAVDMVEQKEDAEGLSAAVQARRMRHTLPKLTPEGTLEYGLVVPKVGQWCSEPHGSGADLEWVMNGGRTSNARSHRTDHDTDRLFGYGSLGSLTDDLPFQRRIVSASKGKNKLPWEMSSFSSSENEQQQSSSPDRKSSDQVPVDDFTLVSKKSETYIPSFSSTEPQKRQSSRRGEFPSQLRRSGSLIFTSTNASDINVAAPKGQVLQRNPSVERTFSLPSNPSTPGSFLLPSYPLATHPVDSLTPTLPRRHADSSLSMSNTWPNKKDNNPHQGDTSPCRETAGKVKGELLSGRSPRPLRASLVSSSSTSSFRQALSNPRATFFISTVVPKVDHSLPLNGERSYNSGSFMNHQPDKNTLPDSENITTWQDDAVGSHEMLNSLRSLGNGTTKRRATVGQRSPDPDSPDSAVRADMGSNSTSHSTKALSSSASESGLSSMSSLNGIKSSDKSIMKPPVGRVPSEKLRSSMSMDFSSLQGSFQRNELLSGQRVTYSNGTVNKEEDSNDPTSPSESKIHHSGRNSPGPDIPEGVIGRGLFETPLFNSPGVSFPPEQGGLAAKPATKPSAAIFSSHSDSTGGSRPDQAKEKVKSVRLGRHKTKLQRLDQLEDQLGQTDQNRERIRHRVRQMLSDSPTNESKEFIIKGLHLNDSALTSTKAESHSGDSAVTPSSPSSPPGPQSPVKCLTPPHQPSPPAEQPHPKNGSRIRRVHSLNRSRLSQSHSSDELTHTTSHKKSPSEPADMGPFSKPEMVLTQSFNLLSSEDWERKIDGLMLLRSLALYHPDTLHSNLHEVCLCVIQEVKNLRSGVSRVAVCTLGELYKHLQKTMDLELEGTVKALLQKAGECNAFIRQDVDAALDCMVQHCTPTRSISALLSGGISHLSPVVRKCAAQHLSNLVKKVGAVRLLSGGKNLTDRILPAVTKLSQDSSQDARYFGRQILLFLSSHPDFDTLLEKYIPSKDLQTVKDTVFTLKTRGFGETPQDTQSARGRRSLPGSGTARASSLNREPLHHTNRESRSHPSCRTQAKRIADKTEYIEQISGLLASKDFKERIKGIDQLVADCQDNPNMVINSIFPVFDALKARLQESNSKVNLYALESLQKIIHLLKDNLSQVVNILVPAIVDNHLNSKNNAIYSAAMGVINALVSNLDNMLLLQPFCTKAQFLSGKAKVDLIEKVADLVTELYPRKPQTVEQKVLPLLWHLLGTSTLSGTTNGRGSNLRGATASLCQAMYAQMGPSLSECAASQPASVHKDLNEILRTLPEARIQT